MIKSPNNGKWYRPVQSLFLYISEGLKSTGNIASFDLDWTLTKTVRGQWPKDSDDITLLPNVPSTLKDLRNKGYTIVVFTNQKSTTENKINFNYQRVNNFINLIPDIPIILMMSIGKDNDIYRKPNTGMYQTLFYTTEKIFPTIERLKPQPTGSVNDITLGIEPTMVLFVGMPGSGKTTYYQSKLQPLGYVHANQDIEGTKARVLKLTRNTMAKNLNVCIDSTNPGQNRREEFYKLANKNGYNIVVIYFARDGRGFNKLRPKPVPTIAYSMYYKYL
ncbi:unnamed protein product, partial [marine sediment metagenome]